MSAFYGRQLGAKEPLPPTDFSQTHVVEVSGDSPNIFGHVLLYVGGKGFGNYFHTPGYMADNKPPYMIAEVQFSTYLAVNGKRELARKKLSIPKPQQARAKLDQLMHSGWDYDLIPNNCVEFVMEVVRAGGNFWDLPTNIPVIGWEIMTGIEKLLGPISCHLAKSNPNVQPQNMGIECP